MRVPVPVHLPDAAAPPMPAIPHAGGTLAFLAAEPDLYTDADAIERFW